jgi:hypothetical protein
VGNSEFARSRRLPPSRRPPRRQAGLDDPEHLDELRQAAAESGDVLLIGLDDIYRQI